jgi:hypothetical protein
MPPHQRYDEGEPLPPKYHAEFAAFWSTLHPERNPMTTDEAIELIRLKAQSMSERGHPAALTWVEAHSLLFSLTSELAARQRQEHRLRNELTEYRLYLEGDRTCTIAKLKAQLAAAAATVDRLVAEAMRKVPPRSGVPYNIDYQDGYNEGRSDAFAALSAPPADHVADPSKKVQPDPRDAVVDAAKALMPWFPEGANDDYIRVRRGEANALKKALAAQQGSERKDGE